MCTKYFHNAYVEGVSRLGNLMILGMWKQVDDKLTTIIKGKLTIDKFYTPDRGKYTVTVKQIEIY